MLPTGRHDHARRGTGGAPPRARSPRRRGPPSFGQGNAVAEALSPDGATLLVLTSGYNRVFDPDTGKLVRAEASTEWVFVYDVRRRDLPASRR